jgi:amidase
MNACSRRHFLDMCGALSGAAAARGLSFAPGAAVALSSEHARAQGSSSDDVIGFRTAVELSRMVRNREIGAVELTEYLIGRIERFDEAINAVVVRDFDRALDAAAAADRALASGEAGGPLHGVPMTIKEAYDVAGLPTTLGLAPFAASRAEEDAVVVQRLKAAGAIILGKTNVPVLLRDYQSFNEIYGTTNNPWDLSRTPGGSSGGSAAALAAGLTSLESGTDIGGSIRNPAHYCGVYGHKPTRNTVPRRGYPSTPVAEPILPPGVANRDLDVVGPLARSAEDLRVALDVQAGPDGFAAAGWRLSLPGPRATSLGDLRVAVWPTDEVAPTDVSIADRVMEIADVLTRAGATVSDRARPSFNPGDAHRTYVSLLGATSLADVSDAQFEELRSAAAQFDPDDQSFLAVVSRASLMDHRTWDQHDQVRTVIRMAWEEFFEEWDLLVCPITATTAFRHDQRPDPGRMLTVNGVARPYWEQIFWAGLATLAYLPSTVFPTGLAEDGLPIGLQAIGPEYGDYTTIEFARLMAQQLGGFRPPRGYGD